MTNDELLQYFDTTPAPEPLPPMTRQDWLDCRFAMLVALWRCTEEELAETARRWLDKREEQQ